MSHYALVTGADRGLGFGLTAGLLSRGWHVFAGQYMPEWPELGRLSDTYSDQLTIVALDVSSIASARAAAAAAAGVTDHLDVIISNAGVASKTSRIPITEPQDYDEMHRLYDVNTLGPLRVVEAFLSLTQTSEMKRLCFVSSEAGSIGQAYRTAWYGYCMSKAALNMGVKLMYNHLRPEGYTFRLYHPGWVRSYMGGEKNPNADLEPEEAAVYALPFFLNPRADEDHLVLRDYLGREWPY
jgi:NAD(P)-dependent dehydrogenase (short-subunit alcohol dehydrogenase family)